MRVLRSALLLIPAALAGACMALVAPAAADAAARLFQMPPTLAVVNLNDVVASRRALAAAQNLSDEALLQDAERFSASLKGALAALQKECSCTLLVSQAVISPHELPDLTGRLKTFLGVPEDEVNSARRALSSAFKPSGTAGAAWTTGAKEAPGALWDSAKDKSVKSQIQEAALFLQSAGAPGAKESPLF